jgi:hypothetical protein
MHWRVIAGKLTIVNTKKIGIASGEKTNERESEEISLPAAEQETPSKKHRRGWGLGKDSHLRWIARVGRVAAAASSSRNSWGAAAAAALGFSSPPPHLRRTPAVVGGERKQPPPLRSARLGSVQMDSGGGGGRGWEYVVFC